MQRGQQHTAELYVVSQLKTVVKNLVESESGGISVHLKAKSIFFIGQLCVKHECSRQQPNPSLTFLKQDEYRQAACRCQTRTAQLHKCKSGAGGASSSFLKSKQLHMLPVLLKE